MPAAGAAATGQPGGDAIDLKVCMNLLKRTMVLLPLIVMVVIVWVRVTLTYTEQDLIDLNNSTAISDAEEDYSAEVDDLNKTDDSILVSAMMPGGGVT